MWRYMGAPCAPLRLRLCSRFTRCAEVVAPCSIILRLSPSEWRMVDRYNHFPSSILHSQLKTPERTSFRGFSLSKKYYFNIYASCGSTHKIEFAKQIHKFKGMVQTTLSCRYAAIHLVYLGIYTREEKMCPSGRGFSLEFARKRGFERETARKTLVFRQSQTPERISFRGFALCFGFLILREHDIEQNRNKCCRYNTGTAKNQLNRLRRLCQNGHIGTHAVADTQSN